MSCLSLLLCQFNWYVYVTPSSWYVNDNGYLNGNTQIKLAVLMSSLNVAHRDHPTQVYTVFLTIQIPKDREHNSWENFLLSLVLISISIFLIVKIFLIADGELMNITECLVSEGLVEVRKGGIKESE